ncbi:hypothetical protein TNIN_147761 [Trichonephila inaurata madagascariensis]|uniref:Uncharacterized protein n=1 Tax=Trichonephila inaurata madagascariensis TaxID=2747483 RepID=A0A8X6XB86_9ARAC|nr:hypothetical protein TNIN_147761 [Trichonephila inaurata madagascariensis]
MPQPDHGHQEMLGRASRATAPSFRPHWTPHFAGNDTSRKMVVFQHSSSHFDANLHTEASDEVEDVRGTLRHTLNPFTEQRKGVSPVRERPSKLIAEVAYIKVAPVSGCVR